MNYIQADIGHSTSGGTTGSGLPSIGATMPDGTVFAGISPDTGRNMFVTPKDASGVLKWKAAMKYAADLDANGHKDWRLPTEAELDVLYQNRDKGALKGTFNVHGSGPSGRYWSSAESPEGPHSAWMERFSDGFRYWYLKDNDASVRPVRLEPRP